MLHDDCVPRRMTRLFPGADAHDIDVIAIACALGGKIKMLLDFNPRFGGKAYDITWISEPQATEAAASGVDIDSRHYDLRLLGRRSIDV